MKLKNLLNQYQHFFELKNKKSVGLKKLGWRAIHILTGVICYPVLGAISRIAKDFLKRERDNPNALEKSRISTTITTPDHEIQNHKIQEQLNKLMGTKGANTETNNLKDEKPDVDIKKTNVEKPQAVLRTEEKNVESQEAKDLVNEQAQLAQQEARRKADEGIQNSRVLSAAIDKAIENKLIVVPEGKTKFDLKNDPKVQKYFLEIQKLRQEKKDYPQFAQQESRILARKVAKAKLAYRLGVKPESTSAGVHASGFMRSLSGKKVGVFKTTDLRLSVIRSTWKNTCLKLGIGQEHILNQGKYAQIASEKAAYIIKSKLGPTYFSLAPVKILHFTNETNEKTEQGAFLVFCKNASVAKGAINLIEKTSFTEQEICTYHSAFLFDFLLGNLDRHNENWMVKTEGNKVTNVLLIDNANILPTLEPTRLHIIAANSRFNWKFLKVADLEIPQNIRTDFLNVLADDAWVENLFKEINNDKEIKKLIEIEKKEKLLGPQENNKLLSYFSNESKEAMKKRVEFLKNQLKLALPGKNITPRLIANSYKP